jgi:hypothetical protein
MTRAPGLPNVPPDGWQRIAARLPFAEIPLYEVILTILAWQFLVARL